MRKNKFLYLFVLIVLLTINVNAKVISKDEIEDDSYIIGNHLFTRDKNTDKNYNGELTTQVMLLASKSITGDSLDDMMVYYKTFLGEWINGITGQSITPPDYFEIGNRNLHDIIPVPNLFCNFDTRITSNTDSQGNYRNSRIVDCTTSAVVDNSLNYVYSISIAPRYNNLENIGGAEFYILKNADGTLPTESAYFDPLTGTFKINSTILTPVVIPNQCGDEGSYCNNGEGFYYEYDNDNAEPFYQIVSRLYYLDGEEKIYSEYSNIQSNGIFAKFGMSSDHPIRLSETINDNYALKVDSSLGNFGPGINGEVNYYNVKFKLNNVDTTKYMIREYRIYSPIEASEGSINSNYYDYYRDAENGSDTLEYMYMESLAKKKYVTPTRLNGGVVNAYLIADVRGMNAFGDYVDMSAKEAYSKKIYWPDEDNASRSAVARATICNLTQTECYEASSSAIVVN